MGTAWMDVISQRLHLLNALVMFMVQTIMK